jgi:hypothetical protein
MVLPHWEEYAQIAIAAVVHHYILLLLFLVIYVSTMIGEAVYRVVPACIRYWIEATEESRLAKTQR